MVFHIPPQLDDGLLAVVVVVLDMAEHPAVLVAVPLVVLVPPVVLELLTLVAVAVAVKMVSVLVMVAVVLVDILKKHHKHLVLQPIL
jgi:hypothetical protein